MPEVRLEAGRSLLLKSDAIAARYNMSYVQRDEYVNGYGHRHINRAISQNLWEASQNCRGVNHR